MSYIDKIEEVAKLCDEGARTLVDQIIEKWKHFEKQAEMYHPKYDVLDPGFHRTCLRELIALLYLTGTGDPATDCRQLREKDAAYGGSWQKRGGQGAFMMLARKADRFIEFAERGDLGNGIDFSVTKADESIADTIGDWRRYLILIEAYHVDREQPEQPKAGWTPGGPEAH